MRVNKLVRDRVPDELRGLGRTISVTSVTGDEYMRRLKEKLVEEASEAARADEGALVEELADVVEVLMALMAVRSTSFEALLVAAAAKRNRLGGFGAGTLLLDNGLPEGP